MNPFRAAKFWFVNRSLIGKLITIAVIIGLGYFVYSRFINNKSATPTYQTAQAEKGTLISTVTASGTVTSSNSINITTSLNGTVNHVYVKNGDQVKQGQKIADITPDQDSLQRQTAAYASYLNAVNSQQNANQSQTSMVAQLEQGRKAILDAQSAVDAMNNNIANGTNNPSTKLPYTDLEKQSIQSALTSANESFSALEQKYNQSGSSINSASTQVSSAWLAYQQLSSTITAPAAGQINNLIIAPGSSLTGVSTSSSGNSNQLLGSITKPQSNLQATVDLTEIDAPKVAPGQKVTMTLDAFPNNTYAGTVLAIDTNGQTSSSVTTYPATISIDTDATNIYPNMSVNANIITSVKDNVILVPNAAVQTQNGQSYVRELKNGQLTNVAVEVGNSNDTQTEITSGVNAGDTVVTNIVTPASGSTSTGGASIFGGGTRGGAGGATFRRIGG